MLLQIYNPSPVPWNDLEVNLVNNRGIISGSIPLPVSFIHTVTISLSFPFFSAILFFSAIIDISPSLSLSMNLIELLIKFDITRLIEFISAYILILSSNLHSKFIFLISELFL